MSIHYNTHFQQVNISNDDGHDFSFDDVFLPKFSENSNPFGANLLNCLFCVGTAKCVFFAFLQYLIYMCLI